MVNCVSNKLVYFSLKIPLLEKGEVLVEEKEKVAVGKILARVSRRTLVEVDLANLLGVSGKKLSACLRVGPGSLVSAGEVVAYSGFLKKKKAVSPVLGKVEEFLEGEGILRIAAVEKPREIFSPVAAKIAKIEKDFLVLEFPAVVLPACVSFGRSGWGTLTVGASDFFLLSRELKEKILLVEKITPVILVKLEALGAVGAVTKEGGIKDKNDKEEEEMGILVLEEKDFEKAKNYTGKRAKVEVGEKRLVICSD